MLHLPFSLFKRSRRPCYYVQFKTPDGSYLPAVSTKQTEKAKAIETAFTWLREGKKTANGASIAPSLQDALRTVKTTLQADFICAELKRKGLLASYVITESRQDEDFTAFLLNFWDYETSPYIREKLRKDHAIHKNYTAGQTLSVQKYWQPYFKDRLLGDITRQDIENFMDSLSKSNLSSGSKNHILGAGTIALRWAYAKEIIEKDITRGIILFSKNIKKRLILSPETAQALFRVKWKDERARLANMLAAVTGIRAGEIQGLRLQDLGKDCLFIRHSWNCKDRLKTTKNNEKRTVEMPFPSIIKELLRLADLNPHGANRDSYVFWSRKLPDRPMDAVPFLTGLRDALIKTGMKKESAKEYVFHGWRHFFASCMKDRLNEKLLQTQTGHKSPAMLEHYADHLLDGDREKIRQAQQDVFGALIVDV
jgi:integrase